MIYTAPNTNKICYMMLPEGIREDLGVGLKELADKYGVSIAVIPDVNWNDDISPILPRMDRAFEVCAVYTEYEFRV